MEKEYREFLAKKQCEIGRSIVKKMEALGDALNTGYLEFLDDELFDLVISVTYTLGVTLDDYSESVVFDCFNGQISFEEMLEELGGERGE
jgi:hypothetical protein